MIMTAAQDTLWQAAFFRALVPGCCSKTSPKDAFSRSGARNVFWRPRSAIAGANVLLSPINRPKVQTSSCPALLFFIPHAYVYNIYIYMRAGIIQSVQRLATGWTPGDRILAGARFSAPFQTGPGAHPASYTIGTGFFPGLKRLGRGFDIPPI